MSKTKTTSRHKASGNTDPNGSAKKVRYAVVGLGYISQVAVLPAFQHALENSELLALVSGDATKRAQLAKKYGVSKTYSYEQFPECLESGLIDAVYIALPNNMHRAYTEGAARAGIHVLCEKPMAVTEQECEAMIEATSRANVKLMIAYRLHFEQGNLATIAAVRDGQIGEPRIFRSGFCQQVTPGNSRLQNELGGGPLYGHRRVLHQRGALSVSRGTPRKCSHTRRLARKMSGLRRSTKCPRRCYDSPTIAWPPSRAASALPTAPPTKSLAPRESSRWIPPTRWSAI